VTHEAGKITQPNGLSHANISNSRLFSCHAVTTIPAIHSTHHWHLFHRTRSQMQPNNKQNPTTPNNHSHFYLLYSRPPITCMSARGSHCTTAHSIQTPTHDTQRKIGKFESWQILSLLCVVAFHTHFIPFLY